MSTTTTAPQKLNLYEGMFILESGQYAADPDHAIQEVLSLLEKAGAKIVAHRAWQEGKLAYEVNEHRKGLHYLAYFEMPGDGIDVIRQSAKLSTLILRHLILKHSKVLFDAMVQALSTHDAAYHAAVVEEPEVRRKETSDDDDTDDVDLDDVDTDDDDE
ncbi:MAG: 30S ribosomal protein S6 [Planctomycetota bacterium]|nr:30S ribosomal protein S6 [Planctomycetota bacterium]MDA1212529.1 30S ribosomal protein S6 [Planctomycetota bacterium]